MISKALIPVFEPRLPQMFYPNPPSRASLQLLLRKRKNNPIQNTSFFHLHQYVSQFHVAVAWDCLSVLFSKASMACTILFQSWLNICSFFMCLFGNVVVIPVTQCMDEIQIKQNKAYLYIVEYNIYCSPTIQRYWLDIEDISEFSFHLSCYFCVVIEFDYD